MGESWQGFSSGNRAKRQRNASTAEQTNRKTRHSGPAAFAPGELEARHTPKSEAGEGFARKPGQQQVWPEGVLRLQLNQLAQKQLAQRNVGQPAGARTVALRDELGRIADTLGTPQGCGEELEMKMERRRVAPKSELPLPALTPKEKKKDGG